MSPKITERTIRAMPYESRIKHYEREKNELFMKNKHLPAKELQEMHDKLIKKWNV